LSVVRCPLPEKCNSAFLLFCLLPSAFCFLPSDYCISGTAPPVRGPALGLPFPFASSAQYRFPDS
jgi:hypothetical protein